MTCTVYLDAEGIGDSGDQVRVRAVRATRAADAAGTPVARATLG